MGSRRNRQNLKKNIWTAIFAIAIIGVVALSAAWIYKLVSQSNQKDIYDGLVESHTQSQESTTEEDSDEEEVSELEAKYLAIEEKYGIEIPRLDLDFADLQENTNEDIYAWIYVPGTSVDYPILQHPTDDSYYLNYNIDGTYGRPGCIYTESRNSKDFTDFNTVIYGHNMKDGTMFRTLHNFEDSEVFDEYQYIYIYTEDDIFVYQIFRAYKYEKYHLLKKFDTSYEGGIQRYIEVMQTYRSLVSNSNDELLESLTTEDKIVTLSTCCGDSNYRYLVQGVLLSAD